MLGLAIAAVALVLLANIYGIHRIQEGHVGVYKKFGLYSSQLGEPGYNFRFPFLSSYEEITVKLQTDIVTNIPCGTSGGVLINFQKIEVVNRLRKEWVYQTLRNYSSNYDHLWIYDKIHHEINQFCSKHTLKEIYIELFETLDEELSRRLSEDLVRWAPGIEIVSVRVTKPRIPDSIRSIFQQMQRQKIEYQIKNQEQQILLEKELTQQKKELISVNSELEVAQIGLNKTLQVKQNELAMAKIEAEMAFERAKTKADSEYYKDKKELQTIRELLTPAFLRGQAHEALLANLTLNTGRAIPQYLARG